MSVNRSVMKGVILASVILMYWVIGYYHPIHSLQEFNNRVILSDEDGLRFPAAGIAYTERAPDWLVSAIDSSSIDISLDVQSSSNDQTGPARILTISENTGFRNITVAQEGVDLIVRLRRSDDTFNGTPPFVVINVFDDLDRHALRVSVKPGKLAISVDGTNRLTAELPVNALDSWSSDYRLALGNEITFDRPWLGTIHQAIIRVNGNQVDYLAPGALALPETYYWREKTYYLQLQLDDIHIIPFYHRNYSPSLFQDWVVNFFGFIPLGFLFQVLFPRWGCIWRVAVICLGVSLVIETMQLFLPWREPSVDDLILNMLGGATGAWAGIKYWKDKGV